MILSSLSKYWTYYIVCTLYTVHCWTIKTGRRKFWDIESVRTWKCESLCYKQLCLRYKKNVWYVECWWKLVFCYCQPQLSLYTLTRKRVYFISYHLFVFSIWHKVCVCISGYLHILVLINYQNKKRSRKDFSLFRLHSYQIGRSWVLDYHRELLFMTCLCLAAQHFKANSCDMSWFAYVNWPS